MYTVVQNHRTLSSHKQTPSGPQKVSTEEWRLENNVHCSVCIIAGNMTKCLLMRGVRLWEVSVSDGSTVIASHSAHNLCTGVTLLFNCQA